MTGVTLSREDWQWQLVPEHLKMTFLVFDDKNCPLRTGKNLAKIKVQLREKLQEKLSAVVDQGLEQSHLQNWNFGTLPVRYEQQGVGYQIKVYPALVDEKKSVAIRLFETESQQQQAMWRGTRRLLLLNILSPIKYLHEKLPNKAKLGLYFNPYGKVLDLIDDCIACAVDKLIIQYGGLVWQQADFVNLQQKIRAQLNDTVMEIATGVEQVLSRAFAINKRLKGKIDITWVQAMADIKAQLDGLIYRGFVTDSGWQRITDSLRYLQAIERRLEKLAEEPYRDRAQMLRVQQVVQSWQQWLNKLSPERKQDEEVKAVRWMIEELRVSLFAQQLGTPYRVSEKRILQIMKQLS